MLIGEDWKLESDSLNVTLYHRDFNKKKGEYYWRAQSFYSSLHNALLSLIDQKVMGTGMKELQDIDQKIEELKSLIPS